MKHFLNQILCDFLGFCLLECCRSFCLTFFDSKKVFAPNNVQLHEKSFISGEFIVLIQLFHHLNLVYVANLKGNERKNRKNNYDSLMRKHLDESSHLDSLNSPVIFGFFTHSKFIDPICEYVRESIGIFSIMNSMYSSFQAIQLEIKRIFYSLFNVFALCFSK